MKKKKNGKKIGSQKLAKKKVGKREKKKTGKKLASDFSQLPHFRRSVRSSKNWLNSTWSRFTFLRRPLPRHTTLLIILMLDPASPS